MKKKYSARMIYFLKKIDILMIHPTAWLKMHAPVILVQQKEDIIKPTADHRQLMLCAQQRIYSVNSRKLK